MPKYMVHRSKEVTCGSKIILNTCKQIELYITLWNITFVISNLTSEPIRPNTLQRSAGDVVWTKILDITRVVFQKTDIQV